jgi:hypothetical protein
MDPSSAIHVGKVGKPDFLASIDDEVEDALNSLGADIIFLLIEKWESDIARATELDKVTAEELLNHYVRLKISMHHLKRKFELDYFWSPCDPHGADFEKKLIGLSDKVKEARRNYYVAKQRYEGQHEGTCSCRGCRCIGSFWG